MNKSLRIMLLGLIATAMIATSAMAEYVFVTKNGKKYHPESSRFANMEGVERITKEEAESRGLEPSKAYLAAADDAAEEEAASKAK